MNRPATLASGVALLFLALHLPFLPQSLEDLDSVNFALGIVDYNVAEHQPHPPGYPLFVGAAKALRPLLPSEAVVLSVVSLIGGVLGIFAFAAVFRRLDPSTAAFATMLAATAPLYWFTSTRPLSDVPGLAAAIGIQALTLRGSAKLPLAAVLAGLATGIRSQVLWLTAPLLVWEALRAPRTERVKRVTQVMILGGIGVLLWLVPIVILEGGPAAYWRALFSQGAEDFSGVQMLWTNRTPRQLLIVLNSAFIVPWGSAVLAGIVIGFATLGLGRLLLRARSVFVTLLVAYGPYVAFNVLFQEAITTRYGLPIVAPMAYLAARGGMMIAPGRWASALVIALGVASAAVGQASVYQYTQARAPAFQLLEDMASAGRDGPPIVFAMHRREELDFRRPIRWVGTRMPAVETRLAAPPKREWLEIVKYWNSGGRRPVWFIADPLRSDLALFDRSDRITSYRWSLAYPSLVGGARPGVMDWHVFDRPGWYLGEGWALTPESAGVAVQDRRGPGLAPIEGWIRRRAQPTTVLVGGRNLNRDGAPASLTITLDGRTIDQTVLPGGFFWKMMPLSSGVLDGVGDYAAIRIAAAGDVAIEQFDAQSPDRVVVAFAEGWHEREYDPVKGRLWRWMSERGTLRVRGTGEAHTLVLSGGTETFRRPSRLVVRAGDRQIAEHTVGSSFAITVPLPAEHLPPSESVITIETDQVYVPAEHSSGSQDRRRLALKIFECRLEPTQGFSGLPGQTQ